MWNKKSAILVFCIVAVILVVVFGTNIFRTTTASGFQIEIYEPEKAYNGTTLFADLHDPQRPRIVEVDMQGDIVWEYALPDNLKQYTNPGFDVELLSDNHILFVAPLNGVYEIDRNGKIVWAYLDSEVSHDADRLPNGNTLIVWGGGDEKKDAQVKEVNPNGEIVWSWYAKDNFNVSPYADISRQGWTHTNAVTRLSNGNTLINMRNFNLTIEVDNQGSVVWSFDWSTFGECTNPHEPEILPDNHLLIALHDCQYQTVEIDQVIEETVWTYSMSGLRTTRDADRLPNGNTLIVGVIEGDEESTLIEVTSDGEIVWQLTLKGCPATGTGPGGLGPGWFYKAERIGATA